MEDLPDISDVPYGEADAALLNEFERRKRARQLAVPTDDTRIKQRLRELGHPICLFGEGPMDRRNRLTYVMSKLTEEELQNLTVPPSEDEGGDDSSEDEEFYTEGSEELLAARRWIAGYSLPRARERIEREKQIQEVALLTQRKHHDEINKYLKKTNIYASQAADSRPIAACRFSPSSTMLATTSWSGDCKLWNVPSCDHHLTLKGHTDRVSGLDFHPQSTMGLSPSVVNLATGSADKLIHLWSLASDLPIGILTGHTMRVAKVQFHPSGRYLASTSFDTTWRFWDVETQRELLLQEGHSKAVFALAMQDDGSLLATGGYDGIGKLWDLRTGRAILDLQGHAKEIYSLDFSPNGYQVASGSGDNTVRVFDLRTMKSLATIPAHKSLISEVRFFRGSTLPMYTATTSSSSSSAMDVDTATVVNRARPSGLSDIYMATASFDGTIKLWSVDDWQLQATLADHSGRVMGMDIARDGRFLASSGFDKSFKLWCQE
ncbi:hypothetical protein IWQ60_005307 [Tieghemiomyces parasiticus]|uniref:Pre-mRNA processing factor 4 (PRP4)-like domain-containing protein n=1 Tax=Tieghemiomyces parasiticus TaxID=78921 RepID=A0A9W8ACK5_9FUNG|nr:hypothetical protein IWQ60_005307 [Tieghemiomyces parasiticus]